MNADAERRARDVFERHGFMRLLGARMTHLEEGFCEVRVGRMDGLLQHDGYFHAAVSAAIADSASGCAAYTLTKADTSILSIEYKINLLAPARGSELITRARVVRAGRTLKVCAADVYSLEQSEVLCATTLSTMMELPPKA